MTPFALAVSPRDRSRRGVMYPLIGKRFFDVTVALAMLIVALPLLAVVLLVTALDGGHPIFRQKRVGRDGRLFDCPKVRSMVRDADRMLALHLKQDPVALAEWRENQKLTSDPRITRFGHFLRKTSLDELPQLWNVIRGDMSLVGPRPVVEEEMERYGADIVSYQSVRPGLTGAWQVSGRNQVSYRERVELDVVYSRSYTLLGDLAIMVKTLRCVVDKTGQ